MNWFGTSWGAPICTIATHVDVPFGKMCIDCAKEIMREDQGLLIPASGFDSDHYAQSIVGIANFPNFVYHLDCFLLNIGVKKDG